MYCTDFIVKFDLRETVEVEVYVDNKLGMTISLPIKVELIQELQHLGSTIEDSLKSNCKLRQSNVSLPKPKVSIIVVVVCNDDDIS